MDALNQAINSLKASIAEIATLREDVISLRATVPRQQVEILQLKKGAASSVSMIAPSTLTSAPKPRVASISQPHDEPWQTAGRKKVRTMTAPRSLYQGYITFL